MARKKRKRDSWGSVTYDDEKQVGRIRYTVKTPDGVVRRSKTVHGTKSAVMEERRRLRERYRDGTYCPNLGDLYYQDYLPHRKTMLANDELSRQTYSNATYIANAYVLPRWKDRRVDEIRPLEIQQWLSGIKGTVAYRAGNLLKQIMGYAVRYGYVRTNPMNVNYDYPSKATIKRQNSETYTAEELCLLWKALVGHQVEGAVLLCGFGSCRVGEALAVRGTDVTALDGYPTTVATVKIDDEVDGFGRIVSRLKTEESERTVILVGDPAARLVILAREAGEKTIVRGKRGGHMAQSLFRAAYADAVSSTGLRPCLPRSLRRSWQTTMRWRLGLDEVYVEPLMGHKMTTVTAKHYDKPDVPLFASVVADRYVRYPYADGVVDSEYLDCESDAI